MRQTIIAALALSTTALAASARATTPAAEPPACAVPAIAESEADIRVPFDIVQGRVYVEARVNGEGPYRFGVDTGASGWGRADASLTAALGLPVHGTTDTSDGVSEATVETVRFDTLALGGLVRRDLEVITRDYSGGAPPEAALSGIIARQFFEDGLLVIDFPARMLSFSRTAPPLGEAGTLGYDRPFRIPVRIGERQVEGQLDTGAEVTMVFPRALYDEVAASAVEEAGNATLTNTVIESGRGTVRGPVEIGGLSLSDVEVRVSDRYPELLIGGHVLGGSVVAIDQRSRRVAVCPG